MCNVNLDFDCKDDEINSLLNPYLETFGWTSLPALANLLKSFWKRNVFFVIKNICLLYQRVQESSGQNGPNAMKN